MTHVMQQHIITLILYFASIDVYFLAWLNIGDNIYGIFKTWDLHYIYNGE